MFKNVQIYLGLTAVVISGLVSMHSNLQASNNSAALASTLGSITYATSISEVEGHRPHRYFPRH